VLAANLDEDTNAALRDFCLRHRVSRSGLIEAFARAITSGAKADWGAVVDEAGRVDAERRARS